MPDERRIEIRGGAVTFKVLAAGHGAPLVYFHSYYERSAWSPFLDVLARSDCPQETRMELSLLSKALDKLSTNDRVAWMLRHVEGLSLEEVAQECGCSLAAAKRRISSASQRISRFAAKGWP